MLSRFALLAALLCVGLVVATIPSSVEEEEDSDETFQVVTPRRRNHNRDGFRRYVAASNERPTSSHAHLERQWNTAQARSIWNEFKEEFNKAYESVEEEFERFKNFFVNHQKISQHNREFHRGQHTYTLKMNEFGDMSHGEFVSTMNGFKRRYGDSLVKRHATTFLPPHNVVVPDAVDWRAQGYVTPVKNQGQCGSCWSFSSTGALEGQHFRKTGKLISLSEQNLVDCSTKYGNQGCNGGLMDQAFQYVKDNNGIDTETSYPYEAKDDRCRFKRTNVGASDSGFVDVPQGNETALQIALATVGPVSVAIDASHESFQFYSQGVYNEPDCSPDQLDHGVLAVGYGSLGEGQDFWIVKNSWGPTWGQKGFIMMTRNQENQCGIASSASYPLV